MKISYKQTSCFHLLVISSILFYSCHTTANVSNGQQLNGKRIGIGEIKLSTELNNSSNSVDTLCDCMVSSVSSSMNPFFQKTGLQLIDIPGSRKNTSPIVMNQLIDSLQIDYLLVGNGLINVVGKKSPSYFMHHLSMQIINVKTKEIIAVGDFSGPTVYPDGAIKRICKKLNKRI
jgi:hypothetical protein